MEKLEKYKALPSNFAHEASVHEDHIVRLLAPRRPMPEPLGAPARCNRRHYQVFRKPGNERLARM